MSEPNYHTANWFPESLLAIERKKINVKMNKPVYRDLPILEISKTLTYEFWNDYFKPNYQQDAKLIYMDTDNYIIHLKTDFYKNIADDVGKRFYLSNYEVKYNSIDRQLPKEKRKRN